jgi:pimeloyl-ACP methyl ester carboxylesterase
MVQKFRKYGNPPYEVAVIHGGPGAIGEMAPVAERLSKNRGILEPFQRADSVEGQVLELNNILEDHTKLPVVLIGFSWGAFLSLLVAAKYPQHVKKLILVSCPPLSDREASSIMPTRKSRLSLQEQTILSKLMEDIKNQGEMFKEELFNQVVELMDKVDSFSPDDSQQVPIEFNYEIYEKVSQESATLRKGGHFMQIADYISCPITFIHGDYDPHPIEGVKGIIKDSQFFVLEKCGHTPWKEQEAKEEFYQLLLNQLSCELSS